MPAPVIRRRIPVPVVHTAATILPPAVPKPPQRRIPLASAPRKIVPIFAVPAEERPNPERNSDGIDYVATIARYKAKIRNPLTAIRAKCVECSGGSLKEVQECRVSACALHPFRMGTNPMHKKTLDRLAAEGGDDE